MASEGCDTAARRGRLEWTTRRLYRAAPMLTTIIVVGGLGPCSKLRGSGPSSTPSTSSAVIAASSASAQAAAAASASAAAAAAASAAAAAAAMAVATDRAKQQLADLNWMVAHNVTSNPAKSGEGDASTKCDAVESSHTALSKNPNPDPELKRILDEAAALCAFDIPLVTASESLDHLQTPSSQASKLLMCNIATKETDRARAIKPKDPKVRRLDARRITVCGR